MAEHGAKSIVTVGDLASWFGVCLQCHHALPPLQTTAPQYFAEGTVECIGCRARVDLWECVRSRIDDDFPPEWGLQGLGAKFALFPFEVHPGKVAIVDLTQYGVPGDAVLLYSSYQSDDVRAIPCRLEYWSKHQTENPRWQAIYFMPVQDGPTDSGEGRALVIWIEGGTQAQVSVRVANAFRELASHNFQGAVVEAFSAFEIALFTFVSHYLERTCASEALRRTTERRLSAYAMMNLLPDLCKELQVRSLSNRVGQALDHLRICRNEILHKGSPEVVTAARAGEGLAAALLGIAFLKYVESCMA
jgi:hypothetical protein